MSVATDASELGVADERRRSESARRALPPVVALRATVASCRYASGSTGRRDDGLAQRAFGGRDVAGHHPRAAEIGQRLAGRRRRGWPPWSRPRAPSSARRVVPDLGGVEPDASQRAVDLRFVREALDGAAQRQHRRLVPPGARVRQPERDEVGRASSGRARPALRAGRWRATLSPSVA